MQGGSLLNFSLPAVWTCIAWVSLSPPPTPFLNAGLSGIQSARYRNELKCRCLNQYGTGIRGLCPVPECFGTGLRYRMPECLCRRHLPRCRCPAMLIYRYRDFVAGVYLSAAPSPPMTPDTPFTHCILVYSILIHTGKGEGVEQTRKKVRGATDSSKAGSKITNMTDCISSP
jgi:hypothetical protein